MSKHVPNNKGDNMRLFASNPLVSMLKADHKKVSALFRAFKEAAEKERTQIVKRVLQELEVHADLEERLIYPAIRQKIDMD
jgi:hemerythrin superfamily protein